MITQRQLRIGTTATTATLALAAALILGGAAGYAVRGLTLPGETATSTPAPQPGDQHSGWVPDPTSEDWRITGPVIELDRLDSGGARLTE